MKTKFPYLTFAAFLTTSLASHAEVLYQSDFTGTTLDSAGLTKSAGAAGGSWAINDAGDFLEGLNGGNARASVSTIDAFALADGYKGFQLDTTFRTTGSMTRFSFGIVDDTWAIPGAQDWLNQSPAGAYGIGFTTAGSGSTTDHLSFNNDAGTLTELSTAQGNVTVGAAWQTMSMIVTDESWSYSLNGAAATTGSHTFDTSRDFNFISYAQATGNADFQNITVTAVRPEWEGGTGNWDTGFTHGASNTHTIAFSGAGGTATNNIADTTLTNVHDIEFMSGAGAYTLAANAGSAGASGGTALTVNGSIINNSANAQTINTALEFAADRTVAANTGDITIGEVISGAGGLTKEGAGTLTLSGDNTYTGGTTLDAGTISVGNNSALGTGTLTLNSGTLRTGTVAVGALSNAIDVSGTTAVFSGGGSLNLAGDITGSGTLVIGGSGSGQTTGSISVSDNLDGFTGKIRFDSVEDLNSFSIGSSTTINTTAALEMTGTNNKSNIRLWKHATFGELSGNGGSFTGDNSILTINQDTDTTFGGQLLDVNSARELGFTKGGSGRLTLSGQNSYEWDTIVNGGTLEVSGRIGETARITVAAGAAFEVTGTGSLGSGGVYSGGGSGAGNIVNNGTFTYNSTTDQTFTSVVSGSGALIKDNSSTLTLSGANTFSGTTTVSAGILALSSADNNIGSSAAIDVATGATLDVSGITNGFELASGQTLSGSGTVAGGMTLTSGSVLSPGNSPGTMATGAQTWLDGGSYLWEINDSDGTQGADSGWDWLDITGALDLTNLSAGGFTIDIDSLTLGNVAGAPDGFDSFIQADGTFDYEFTIATASAGVSGFDASLFTLDTSGFSKAPGWDWQIKLTGNDLVLEAYAVPEPSSSALLGLGALAIALRRRRS